MRHKVTLLAFPLSYLYGDEWVTVQAAATVFGKGKEAFAKELAKELRVPHLELTGDFLMLTIKEPAFLRHLYTPEIVHVEPALISPAGYEVVTIGCFERAPLARAAQLLERYGAKLLSLRRSRLRSASIMRLRPELTARQREAMELAIERGYYEIPRKTSVAELARIAHLGYATFHRHLRTAERKLLPYSFNSDTYRE